MSTSQRSDIAGAVYAANENYVLISSYDIYDRDYHQELFNRVPRASALSWMRSIKGYMSKRQVNRHEYYFYEEGQYMAAAAEIAVAVDNTTYVTVTISAADHDNAGTESFPVVGQTVVFSDESIGYVQALSRSSANAHTFDIYPANSGVDLVAAAQLGTICVFYSNAQIEKSAATEGRIPKVDKVTNFIQTFREKYEVTDHAEQNQTEFSWKGQKFLHVKGIDETTQRFALQEEMGLLINDSSENLNDAALIKVQLAKGLIPQITDNGNTLEYFGKPDMTTFDDAILLLNKNYGDHEYVVGMGLNASLGMKNWLIDFAAGGDNNISFASEKQQLNFNFKRIFIEPYMFNCQTWDIFSHADTLGAGTLPYKDMMVFIPTGKTKNPNYYGTGGTGNDYEPYCQIAYARIPGAPHENKGDHKMWETGANARTGATDDILTRAIHMASWKSLELRCRNKFLVTRKAG